MTRLSRPTVYRLLRTGELPSLRFGRSYRVTEEAVDEYIARAAGHNRNQPDPPSTTPMQPPHEF
ncbi:helix-turn-helix domain-containing protein [Arthrobacter sp. K5]|uniref:Helix-turn-helix domain-containing protein n=1 Tax=Arthrobacter sp. K5 TaxID=2839623 RepID=A0AAU8EVS4_9MICC